MNFEGKQQSLLTFRVGSILCCAPSLSVTSIITPPKLTHPPGSNKAQPGIFKHGSKIVKVVDLRQKFGVGEISEKGNLIITLFEKESFAFWVDQIIDVCDFPVTGWSNLPSGIPRDIFTRTLLINKNIYLYTEFEKLTNITELSYLKNTLQPLKQKNIAEANLNSEPVKPPLTPKEQPLVEIRKPCLQPTGSVINKKTENVEVKAPTQKIIPRKVDAKKYIEKNNPLKKQEQPHPRVNTTRIKSDMQTNLNDTIKKEFKAAPDNKISVEKDSSGLAALFIFLLIFCVVSAALYYLFSSSIELRTKPRQNHIITKFIEPVDIDPEPVYKAEPIIHIKKVIDSEVLVTSRPAITDDEIILDNKQTEKTTMANAIIPDAIIPSALTPDAVAADAIISSIETPHAEIQKSLDDVIITVYEPAQIKKILKPLIIHTVIKGDTLWAITKKYIHDPFRYPELAQLNNIENPHRIYPGNQVQIRTIHK